MFQTLIHDGSYMAVCQRIENSFSVSSKFDQLHLLQYPELMGDRTLGHGKTVGDILDTKLLYREYIQDTDPGRVAENLEQIGKPVKCIVIDRVIYMWFLHLSILQTVNLYCS